MTFYYSDAVTPMTEFYKESGNMNTVTHGTGPAGLGFMTVNEDAMNVAMQLQSLLKP